MSSSYVFTDPATGKTRFFYGYLYDCHTDTCDCPYLMKRTDDRYCSHPNSREYGCGKRRRSLHDGPTSAGGAMGYQCGH